MPRKPSLTSLDKKLIGPITGGGLWSQLVKIRAGLKCEVCGKKPPAVQLQAHHIIGKNNWRLRYELRNGACLCAEHHNLGKQSAEQNPVWFIDEWMVDNRCEDLDYLMSVWQETKKWPLEERQELVNKYKKMIDEYAD